MIRNSRRMVVLAVAGAVAIAPVISGCGAGSKPQTAAPTQLTEGVNFSVPKGEPVGQIDVRNMFLLGPRPDTTFGQGSSLPLYASVINQVKSQDRLVSVTSPAFSQAKITGGAVTLPPATPDGTGSAVQLIGNAATPTPGAGKATGKPSTSPSTSPSGSATATPSGQATGVQPGEPGAAPSGQATATPSNSATPTGGAAASATPAPGAAEAAKPEGTATPSVPSASDGKSPLVVLTGLNHQLLGGETLAVTLRFERAGSIEVSVPVIPQQGEYSHFAAVSAGTPVPGASAQPGGHGSPAGEHGTSGGEHGAPAGGHPSGEPATGTPAPGGPAPTVTVTVTAPASPGH